MVVLHIHSLSVIMLKILVIDTGCPKIIVRCVSFFGNIMILVQLIIRISMHKDVCGHMGFIFT